MKRFFIIVLLLMISLVGFPSRPAFSVGPEASDYAEGRGCYERLLKSGSGEAEGQWRECISFFEGYYTGDPRGAKAVSALYSSARLKQEHYALRKSDADAEGAVKDFNELVRQFPASSLADDALYRIGCLRQDALGQPDRARKAFSYLLEHYPQGDMALQAGARLKKLGASQPDSGARPAQLAEGDGVLPSQAASEEPAEERTSPLTLAEDASLSASGEAAQGAAVNSPSQASMTTIQEVDLSAETTSTPAGFERKPGMADAFNRATLMGLSVNNAPGGTTVRLQLDRDVEHSVEFTEMGVRTGSPPELDVVLLHTKSARDLSDERLVESRVIDGYEIKKLILSSGIKVSFTLKQGTSYEVRKTGDGLAVVFGGTGLVNAMPSASADSLSGKGASSRMANLRIVVDPGHGGDDEGAVGPDGTLEKDVTLEVAKRLSAELREKLGAKVYLTRSGDQALSLEERNAIAVTKKADLFISIHANASRDAEASGVETYFLNNASDEAAGRLAARENKSAMKKLPEVEHIISTMLQNYDAAESKVLADSVQERLSKKLKRSHGQMRDRGVRSALFYVLVGAKCPAILVETAFISNPREEKLLTDDTFQRDAAQAIADGVKNYLKVRDKALVSL